MGRRIRVIPRTESNAETQTLTDTRLSSQARDNRTEHIRKNATPKHAAANPSQNAIMPPDSSRLATPSIEHVPPLGTHSSTDALFGKYNAKNFQAKYDPNTAQNAPTGTRTRSARNRATLEITELIVSQHS